VTSGRVLAVREAPRNRGLIISLLTERARTGAVVVIASHDPEVVDVCGGILDL
jgi:ABC-type lipoprotein export system ATPase subunit